MNGFLQGQRCELNMSRRMEASVKKKKKKKNTCAHTYIHKTQLSHDGIPLITYWRHSAERGENMKEKMPWKGDFFFIWINATFEVNFVFLYQLYCRNTRHRKTKYNENNLKRNLSLIRQKVFVFSSSNGCCHKKCYN